MKKTVVFASLILLTLLSAGCCGKGDCTVTPQKKSEETDVFNKPTPILGGGILSGFNWKGESWPVNTTHVKVDRTADGCFLAEFTCFHLPGLELVKKGKKEDDMNIFAGENVELFLCPDPAKKVYYQIAVSPTTAAYTAKGRDFSWKSPGLSKKVEFFKDHYKLTLKIPFKDLGIAPPADGTLWKVNFCRTHFSKGFREVSNWAGSSNYHDLSSFGEILFSPKNSSSSIILDSFLCRNGLVEFKFNLNKVKTPMEVWIRRKEFTKKVGILPIGKPSITFRVKLPGYYVPLKYDDKIRIFVKDAKSKEEIFSQTLKISNNIPNFLVLDKFYYKKGDKITFRIQPPVPGKLKNVTAHLKNEKRTFLRQAFAGNSGTIDTAKLKLAPGRYVLEATDGNGTASRVLFIREKDYSPKGLPSNEPLVKKKGLPGMPGVLTSGGKEVFLVGASTAHNGASYTSQNCFNLSYGKKYSATPFVLLGGTPGKRIIRSPETAYLYTPKAKFMKDLVSHIGKRDLTVPAINRLTYEAQLPAYFPGGEKGKLVKDDTFAVHREMYQKIKAKYPNALISLQTERLSTVPGFINSCDILEIVPSGSYGIVSMQDLPKGIRNVANACKDTHTPVILWIGVTIPNNLCRRVEEVRATLYLSVIYGISGTIFHMGHDAMPKNNTRMWNFLSQILGEIQSFHGDFVTMRPVKDGEIVRVKNSSDLVYRVRAGGDKAVMVLVSTTPYDKNVTFYAKDGYVFECGKSIVTMQLTPYESLVLRLKKKTK